MFNPVRAVLDGYYPSQRDQDGAFSWMSGPRTGAIFPSSRDEFSAGEFHSDEGKNIGPFTPKNAAFPFSSDTGSWGGGPYVPNFNTTDPNSAYGINLAGNLTNTMFRSNPVRNWTWAGVLKHFNFPDALWNKQVFRMQRIFILAYNYIHINENSVYGFRVSLDQVSFVLDAPPNNDAANDPSRGTRWVVTYERDDEELRIYQDGVLAASGSFAQTTINISGDITTLLWSGHGKGLDSFSGFFGASCFMDRCWTPRQVEAWSGDPWGQYRPMYPFRKQPDCMDGSVGDALALDGDVGTDLALDGSVGDALALAGDVGSTTALSGSVGNASALSGSVGICEKENPK